MRVALLSLVVLALAGCQDRARCEEFVGDFMPCAAADGDLEFTIEEMVDRCMERVQGTEGARAGLQCLLECGDRGTDVCADVFDTNKCADECDGWFHYELM